MGILFSSILMAGLRVVYLSLFHSFCVSAFDNLLLVNKILPVSLFGLLGRDCVRIVLGRILKLNLAWVPN